jgi:hypothetical protein
MSELLGKVAIVTGSSSGNASSYRGSKAAVEQCQNIQAGGGVARAHEERGQ